MTKMEFLPPEEANQKMEALLRRARNRRWIEDPPDHLGSYIRNSEGSQQVQVSSPGVLTKSIDYRIAMPSPGGLRAGLPVVTTVEHQLMPRTMELAKSLPEWQVTHRSRSLSVSPKMGLARELMIRANRVRELQKEIQEYKMPSQVGDPIQMAKAEGMIQNLTFSREYLMEYLKDRTSRSATGGIRWAEIANADDDKWNELKDLIVTMYEAVLDGTLWGKYFADPFYQGSRARGSKIPSVAALGTQYEIQANSVRGIFFTEMLSTVGAFLPKDNKERMMDKVWQATLDEIQPPYEPITPLVLGGEIVTHISELLSGQADPGHPVAVMLGDDFTYVLPEKDEHGLPKIRAYDGVTFDSVVGGILPESFSYSKTTFGGHVSVPSGVVDTSLDDTIGLTWITTEAIRRGKLDSLQLIERQAEDELRKFLLGMSYLDAFNPCIVGFKLATDTPESMNPAPINRWAQTGSRPENELEFDIQSGAFHGHTIDGESLLTWFENMKPVDYISPEKLIQDAMADELERVR